MPMLLLAACATGSRREAGRASPQVFIAPGSGMRDSHSLIEEELLKAGFRVINRRHLDAILSELKFSQTGAVSAGEALRTGKLSAGKVMIRLEVVFNDDPMTQIYGDRSLRMEWVLVEQGETIVSKQRLMPDIFSDAALRSLTRSAIEEFRERYTGR